MTLSVRKSFDLPIRLRRNRKTEAIRKMVQETKLSSQDLIVPLFVIEGEKRKIPIESMPNVQRLSIDLILEKAKQLFHKGILSVALFPVIDPSLKTDSAQEAWNPNGLLARAIDAIKSELPQLCVIADVALDPYTLHGHDGVVNTNGEILNDETIECLIKMSLTYAQAGIDILAPSDMMDGRVKFIREALDRRGFHQLSILAYSAKYASALYAPFRDAALSRLKFGDKKSYQMDPANSREALLEAALDEYEGADILMVKPAGMYLDVIANLRKQTNRPIASYHVSGEYAMVMAAEEKGWLNAKQVFCETLLSIKRAGADLIFTYAAELILDEI